MSMSMSTFCWLHPIAFFSPFLCSSNWWMLLAQGTSRQMGRQAVLDCMLHWWYWPEQGFPCKAALTEPPRPPPPPTPSCFFCSSSSFSCSFQPSSAESGILPVSPFPHQKSAATNSSSSLQLPYHVGWLLCARMFVHVHASVCVFGHSILIEM